MNANKKGLIIVVLLGMGLTALCQQSDSKVRIKSLIISEERHDMLIKKQFTESETYYDLKGNITEDITYKQGKIDKHFKYQFDNDNNKIREEEFDASGKIIEYSEYKYENGLRSEKKVFDSNRKIKFIKYYRYTTY